MSNTFFKFRQFTVCQHFDGMKVGSDGVLLGAWANGGQHILDIGAGTGLISLMMAQRFVNADICAVDISKSACQMAYENIANSIFASRIRVKHIPIQSFFTDEKFDAIVSNPPFFIDSMKNPESAKMVARHTDTLSYSELFCSVKKLLSDDGCFSAIIPSDYKDRFVEEGCLCGFFISRIHGVKTVNRKSIKRYLLEFRLKQSDIVDEKTFTMMNNNERSEWYEKLVSEFYL